MTVPADRGPPRVAIIIDDVGLDAEKARLAIALPAEVTLSFLPYAPNVQTNVDRALAAGHEVFLHLPMEAVGGEDPGPNALRVAMDHGELARQIAHNLSAFHGYVGVNNHMGSRFTADAAAMRTVIEALRDRGLIFIDSRTTALTKAEALAREMGVPTAARNVFLDNTLTEDSIAGQFSELLNLSAQQGVALAIGHPHLVTLEFLSAALPTLRGSYALVAASAAVFGKDP